jgi:hypothetical protein
MKIRLLWALIVTVSGILASVSCRQSEVRTVTIHVPQMSDAAAVRIVTNAALDEIYGRNDGVRSDYEVDLSRKILLYHESQSLLAPSYQRRIEARIAEVGYPCKVTKVRLNPPALVPTLEGPVQTWPDRYTAVISVPGMTSNKDANIVVDAIAYARLGADDSRLSVSGTDRRVVAIYDSMRLSRKNIEYAIACSGYDANDVPARLGAADAMPHGWAPVKL